MEISKEVLIGILDGKYHLLVGAGLSADAFNGDGFPLPVGDMLKDEIFKLFSLPESVKWYDLQKTYGAVQDLGFKDGAGRDIDQFLTWRFSECKGTWHNIVGNFNWQRIWTLNVDDLLENSMQSHAVKHRSFTWSEDYRDRSKSYHDIIHLHGFVGSSKKDYIFSTSHYQDAVAANETWHSVFRKNLANEPFIIVGSQLHGEFDFQDAIDRIQERKDSPYPTILVTTSLDEIQSRRLSKRGVIILNMKAQEFFSELSKMYAYVQENFDDSSIQFLFSQYFLDYKVGIRDPRDHDFYSGDEPTTNDIKNGLDYIFDKTTFTIENLTRLLPTNTGITLCRLSGLPGSGKSTAALRIGYSLSQKGYSVYICRNISEIDVDIVLSFSKSRYVVLIFDNAFNYAAQITEIAEKMRRHDASICIIYSDRTKAADIVESRLYRSGFETDISTNYEYLNQFNAQGIHDILESKGRLGRLALNPDVEERVRLIKSKKQLVSAMYFIQEATQHRERMISEFKSIQLDYIMSAYIIICALNSEGMRTPLGWLSNYLGVSQVNIIDSIRESNLTMIRINEDDGIFSLSAKNRVFSSDFMKNSDDISDLQYTELKYRTLLGFIRWLSRNINHTNYGQAQTSRYYVAAIRLLSYTLLRSWVANKYVSLIYKGLTSWWGKNARFWEQYSLFKLAVKEYRVALSYSQNAISISNDAFTNNTAGKILMQMSYWNEIVPGSEKSLEYLRDGIEHLNISFEKDRISKYQFHTFFAHTLAYARNSGSGIPEWLNYEFNSWMVRARHYIERGDSEFDQKISSYQFQWLRLMAKSTHTPT